MKSLAMLIVAISIAIAPSLHAGTPDVAIEMNTTFHISRDTDTTFTIYSNDEVRQTYLSKRSTNKNTFSLSEQFYNTISDIEGSFERYHRDGDPKITSEYGEGSDAFISDFKVHTIAFPDDIDTGETISFEYRRDYQGPAYLPILDIPNVDYVRKYVVTFEHPRGMRVDFDFFFPDDSIPFTIDRSDPKETILTFADVHARKQLPHFPYNNIRVAAQVILHDGGRAVTPNTFADFTGWYTGMFNHAPVIAPAYDTLLKRELVGARTELEKLRVIHDFVRKNIRYIADEEEIHAFVPHDPSMVLARGYGDCKDRAYLVATLARREGIEVDMGLLSTSPEPHFSGTHLNQFNHVICAYGEGRKRIFFDPTHKYCEFGNLPECDVESEILILDRKHPERVVIPAPNLTPSIIVLIEARIDSLKRGSALITLRNDLFHYGLEAGEKQTGVDQENFLSNMVTTYFNKLSFDYFTVASRTDTSITFRATADLSEFIIASTGKRYVSQMPFRLVDPEVLERTSDSLPIYNESRMAALMTIDLQAPGFSADSSSIEIGTDPRLHYSSSVSRIAPERYRLIYDGAHLAKRVTGSDRAPYLDFCRAFLKLKKNMYVLTNKDS